MTNHHYTTFALRTRNFAEHLDRGQSRDGPLVEDESMPRLCFPKTLECCASQTKLSVLEHFHE